MNVTGRFLWVLSLIAMLGAPLAAAEANETMQSDDATYCDEDGGCYHDDPNWDSGSGGGWCDADGRCDHDDPNWDSGSGGGWCDEDGRCDHEDPEWDEPARPTYEAQGQDPCAEIWADFDANAQAMNERHDAEWREHDAKWDAHYADDNRTPEEDRAFEERMHQSEREMNARHDQEFRQLERRAQDDCDAKVQAQHDRQREAERSQHPDDPCRDLWEAHDQKWRELERRHKQEWRAMEDERHAFYMSNHSQEDADAFEERMRQKEQTMQERHERERKELERGPDSECRERHRAQMKDERARQMQEERARRAREYRDMDPEMSQSMREMDALRMECEERAMAREDAFHREMDEKRRAFEESGRTDHEAFEQQIMEYRQEFEREMMALRAACEEKMRAYYDEHMGDRMERGDDYERMGSWSMEERDGSILLHGKYMSLVGDPSTNTIGEVAVAGQVYIRHVGTTGHLEDFEMDEEDGGSTLTGYGEGLRMRLHDNPGGVINFKAEGESFELEIPSTFEVSQTPSGWAWSNGEHRATLRAEGAEYDEASHTLTVPGQATFMLPGSADNQVLPKVANKYRGEILDAVENKQLGAEITVAGSAKDGALDDTIVYDNVDVDVETPDDAGKPVAITVSADSSETGKTFVLNMDEDLYDLKADLDVTYFDIDEETGAETPAQIQKASSIGDVLDASDDETAEYWIVLDEDGVQVLVSVPNWSTHRFKVQGAEPAAEAASPFENIPAPPLALVALAAVAAAAFVARRRD